MHFVQTTFLAAMAAIAVPVIVHLMFRSQFRRVNLGTLRFLKQVLERNARRQRILRWLLLALRCAAMCVLAVLFARPYFVQAEPGGAQKLLLVLIDGSASMDLKGERGRLVEQAIAETRDLVAGQGPRTRIEVAFFDQTVRPLAPVAEAAGIGPRDSKLAASATATRRDSALKLLSELPAPPRSFRATNYGAALAWARDIAISSGVGTLELHLFTDLQQSGLDWSEVEPMPEKVVVHLHDLGRAVVNNVAVAEARAIRPVIRPNEAATIQATVFNGGAFPLEELSVLLRLESDTGKLTQRERVKLEPASTAVVKFEVPSVDAGFWHGTVSIETDDDLKFDNSRHLAVYAAPPYRVLLADGQPSGSPLAAETYFLATALRLAGPDERFADSPFDPAVAPFTSEDHLPNVNGYDVVVLANVGRIPASDAERLAEFVQRGGGLIVFGGDRVTPAGYEALAKVGLVPGRIAGPVTATDLPFRFDTWDDRHPVLAPFNDPQHGDLRRIAFRGYTRIIPTEEKAVATDHSPARVLAQFRNGDPAIVEQYYGHGLALWFTSSCDRGWSEWPSSRLYVPLVHQLIGQSLGLNEGGPVRPVLIDAESNLPMSVTPGVVSQRRYWQVINASPRESETDRTTPEEFASRFQLKLQASDDSQLTAGVARSRELRTDEEWHWAALLLAGMLLMESFVANRTVS